MLNFVLMRSAFCRGVPMRTYRVRSSTGSQVLVTRLPEVKINISKCSCYLGIARRWRIQAIRLGGKVPSMYKSTRPFSSQVVRRLEEYYSLMLKEGVTRWWRIATIGSGGDDISKNKSTQLFGSQVVRDLKNITLWCCIYIINLPDLTLHSAFHHIMHYWWLRQWLTVETASAFATFSAALSFRLRRKIHQPPH